MLTQPSIKIDEFEMKKAIFSMDPNKSLGPDGFSMGF